MYIFIVLLTHTLADNRNEDTFDDDFLAPLETPHQDDNTTDTAVADTNNPSLASGLPPLEGAALTTDPEHTDNGQELPQMDRKDMPMERETFLIAKGNTPVKGRPRGNYSPRPQPKPVVVKEEASKRPVESTDTVAVIVKKDNGLLERVKKAKKSPSSSDSKKDVPIIKQQSSFKARNQ